VNQVGTLQIGLDQDPLKQQFVFTLDSKGRAKATGLPSLTMSLAKGQFAFKAMGRKELTAYFNSLINQSTFQANGHYILNVPVSLTVGNTVFMGMTFQLDFAKNRQQTSGKGSLIIPKTKAR